MRFGVIRIIKCINLKNLELKKENDRMKEKRICILKPNFSFIMDESLEDIKEFYNHMHKERSRLEKESIFNYTKHKSNKIEEKKRG